MKIVSFNVNSVRMRLHQLQALTDQYQPDIIGLQETKVQDHEFPIADIEKMGYQAVFMGQKTHYGVALLYKPNLTLVDCQYGWSHDTEEAQKRLIIADFKDTIGNQIRVINGYFPQGENRSHPTKFPAKERFYQDLMNYLNQQCDPSQNLVVMGDFNISPEDIDIGIGEPNRKRWLRDGKTSFLPEERVWWSSLIQWGLQDSYRKIHPNEDRIFSWFDYRSKGFNDEPKRGLRIDTLLATAPLIDKATDSGVAYDIRAMEKPSDHAPVWTEFNL
ncbi:MAG: exodeoxyribonuclease III [Piscirickettsiaceae bacterium CG_4_9_14_3_um_filter_43_564]|nr:exodeoxyribonuclease III [Thiomicrospira sp.]OIP95872.1 MAG: exodeoxyribonuclease III [Thiomicrospira sp. CG2_30_44_34]PIQ06464.1 MAG: exodeoxyribonuclease III [Piscirickettsiaceae bacterium CG18_big_fil_WC_8_21_14_2_50_44_103]PIU38016.1 MAG: exodeoxyribonuclease III [Piscirickettsiaceae bacterium CG07_land_8_20_14_0_80_44_28]PIW57669.1 MAG: exodeoxyribonuclease III [Piscirickettsiaceae bacterium CG12_big_fil_rev_8_21_14_0_65_44_934]PIW78080.1 MAG: exodeoxyribonuclease III [Piscirickettsiac